MIVTLTPLFMAIAIDVMQGQGFTNEMCLKLQPKTKVVSLNTTLVDIIDTALVDTRQMLAALWGEPERHASMQ